MVEAEKESKLATWQEGRKQWKCSRRSTSFHSPEEGSVFKRALDKDSWVLVLLLAMGDLKRVTQLHDLYLHL